MKKIFTLLLCICLVFTFVACGNDKTSTNNPSIPSGDMLENDDSTTPSGTEATIPHETQPTVPTPDGDLIYNAKIYNEKVGPIQNMAHASIRKYLENSQNQTQYVQADPIAMSVVDIIARGEWRKMTSMISLNSKTIFVANKIPNGDIATYIDFHQESPYGTFLTVATDTTLVMFDSNGKKMFTIPFDKTTDTLIYSSWPKTYVDPQLDMLDSYLIKIFHDIDGEYSLTTYKLQIENNKYKLNDDGYAWVAGESKSIKSVLLDNNGNEIGLINSVKSMRASSVGDYLYADVENVGLVQVNSRDNGFVMDTTSKLPKLDDAVIVDDVFYTDASLSLFSVQGNSKYVFAIWEGSTKDENDTIACFALPNKHTVAQLTLVKECDNSVLFVFNNGDVCVANGINSISHDAAKSEKTHAIINMIQLKNTSYIKKHSKVKSIDIMDDRAWILMEDGQIYCADLTELSDSNVEFVTKSNKYDFS